MSRDINRIIINSAVACSCSTVVHIIQQLPIRSPDDSVYTRWALFLVQLCLNKIKHFILHVPEVSLLMVIFNVQSKTVIHCGYGLNSEA